MGRWWQDIASNSLGILNYFLGPRFRFRFRNKNSLFFSSIYFNLIKLTSERRVEHIITDENLSQKSIWNTEQVQSLILVMNPFYRLRIGRVTSSICKSSGRVPRKKRKMSGILPKRGGPRGVCQKTRLFPFSFLRHPSLRGAPKTNIFGKSWEFGPRKGGGSDPITTFINHCFYGIFDPFFAENFR